MFVPRLAKASCASQVETARAVQSELGPVASHNSGISDWARVGDTNTERDVHRAVKKHGTALPIPITTVDAGGRGFPWINPLHWFRYIITHGLLYMMSGLCFEDRNLVGQTWQQFWKDFRILQPGFSLFQSEDFDPSTTIGLFLHGDEGRTLKRGGLMITSLQSVLGQGFDRKRLKRDRESDRLHVNFAGHTFITRLVVSALPKTEYQADPDAFHNMMDKLAEEMDLILKNGIRDRATGVLYKFCIVGIKGDMPYLQKVGRLKRSWNTQVKRGRARREPPGTCHLCLAGTTGCPCEDTSHSPCWLPTIGVKVPWDIMPGIVRMLPHDMDHPGSHLKPDLWHCIHLGCGKSFIASTIQLCLPLVPGNNNDARFEWLTNHYISWCRSVRTSCHVSKITPYLVSYSDSTGATGNWSKGSLSTTLMKWIVVLLADLHVQEGGALYRCKEAARALNSTLSFLYGAPLFLDRNESLFVYTKGMFFLQVYTSLASEMFSSGRWYLYPLFPKIHAVHHVWHEVRENALLYGFSMNPLTASCQQDEDVVE